MFTATMNKDGNSSMIHSQRLAAALEKKRTCKSQKQKRVIVQFLILCPSLTLLPPPNFCPLSSTGPRLSLRLPLNGLIIWYIATYPTHLQLFDRQKQVKATELNYWKVLTKDCMSDESDKDKGTKTRHSPKWRSQRKTYTYGYQVITELCGGLPSREGPPFHVFTS